VLRQKFQSTSTVGETVNPRVSQKEVKGIIKITYGEAEMLCTLYHILYFLSWIVYLLSFLRMGINLFYDNLDFHDPRGLKSRPVIGILERNG
jgi:hypothetical protein